MKYLETSYQPKFSVKKLFDLIKSKLQKSNLNSNHNNASLIRLKLSYATCLFDKTAQF